jgi:adenylylsulfate kinase
MADDPTSENVYWQESGLTQAAREKLGGHRGACVWLTGLSGSGKTTIARELERQLYQRDIRTFMLDGDNIRHGLNKDLGFSAEDRNENIRRIGEVAKLFVHSGTIVIASFISPYREVRDALRQNMDPGEFIEVHVDAPLDVCEDRDPKGLYERVRDGEIDNFTGIDAPYEQPLDPELHIDTEADADEKVSAARIVSFLEENGYLDVE